MLENVLKDKRKNRFDIDDIDALTRSEIDHILRKEEVAGEKIGYKFRWGMLLMLLLFSLMNVFTHRFAMITTYMQFVLLGGAILYQIILHFLFKKKFFHISLMYTSITIDVTFISLMLLVYYYTDHVFGPITSALLLVYFIIIAIAGTRHNIRLSLYAGLLAAVQYFIITLITKSSVTTYSEELVTLTSSVAKMIPFKLPSGDFLGQIFKSIYIVFTGGVIAFLAHKTQKMVHRMASVSSQKYQSDIERMKLDIQRTNLQNMFGKYVDKTLADNILSEKINLAGEKKSVSVLFVDVRDFTELSQQNDPRDVIVFLNMFFSVLAEVVSKYGGFINKFMGDAMMVVYGAPLTSTTHAKKAVKSALGMIKAIRDNQDKFKEAIGRDSVEIGVSICTGKVIAGNIGSENRVEYTIIGNVVNLASRLEGLNKRFSSKIIIDDATYFKTKKIISLNESKKVKIRGFKDEQTVHLVKCDRVK